MQREATGLDELQRERQNLKAKADRLTNGPAGSSYSPINGVSSVNPPCLAHKVNGPSIRLMYHLSQAMPFGRWDRFLDQHESPTSTKEAQARSWQLRLTSVLAQHQKRQSR